MITSRAILVGFVGGCFYLIALVNSLSSFYNCLTWLSVGILVSSMGIAFLSLVGVECKWQIERACVTESVRGRDSPEASRVADDDIGTRGLQLDIELSNSGTLNKTGIVLEVQLQARGRKAAQTRRFLIEALPSGTSVKATLSLHDIPRGRYTLGTMRLVGSDVLGLFRMQRKIHLGTPTLAAGVDDWQSNSNKREQDISINNNYPQELVVGPAMATLREAGPGSSYGSAYNGWQISRQLGQSDEIRGTRQYVAGDDLRQVHWKSTARRGELVVKEFHRASQNHCTIIWDGAAHSTWGHDLANSTEYGIRVVASLCRIMLERSRPCSLLRIDGRPLQLTSERRSGGSGLNLTSLLEVLADADASRIEPLSSVVSRFLTGRDGAGDFYLVTASLSPDVQHTATLCAAHGGRVTIVQVNGAAFLAAGSTRSLRGASRTRPRQQWQAFGLTQAGEVEVTPSAYETQLRAVRAAGFKIIPLVPGATPHDVAGPVVSVLRQILLNRIEGFSPSGAQIGKDSLLDEADLEHMLGHGNPDVPAIA